MLIIIIIITESKECLNESNSVVVHVLIFLFVHHSNYLGILIYFL